MASAGNSNQSTGPPFDMHHLFNPVSPQNSSNLTTARASSPSPSSSYPTPTSSSSYPPPSGPFPFHPHYIPYPPQDYQHQLSNMHTQKPISYPTPPPHLSSPHNPNSGTRLMALLSTQNQSPSNLDLSPHPIMTFPSSASDFSMASNTPPSIPSTPHVNLVSPHHTPARLLSSKLPKGRHLIGDHVVYDINVSLQGEVQPQLEVTPITKYTSDPGLFVGRQIAVNRTYICYGLKLGNIRVLNINTAVRSLLRGHTQRVSDMAFFAEDVHFLASVSVDKRVFIWKIDEGPDVEDKPQITGKIVLAIQIIGEGDVAHPRVCWHSHKQEILVVGIGNRILKIDTTKVGKREGFSAEEPLRCPIDRLIDGVQYVGKHDGEITELSMCQWMTTRLASASRDGTVKIWEDRKTLPIAILKPHNGNPVNSVTFLTAPHRPDHIVLITGGPLNQELKIWASASEEGWLLPSDVDSWHCTQTLEMKSSAESNIKDAFFNQVVALPHAGLFLLANARKNAIYAVHIEYGPNPAASRLDYIAEFTVTMPILSVTGTSDSLPDGEHVVQVYCVQTQAIQQYALNLSQCLPPPLESMDLEKTDSTASRAFDDANTDGSTTLEHGSKPTEKPVGSATPKPLTLSSSTEGVSMTNRLTKLDSSEASNLLEVATSYIEPKPDASPSSSNAVDSHTLSPTLPLSPKLSRKLSGFRSPSNNLESSLPLTDDGGEKPVRDYSVDRRMETVKENLANVTSSGDKLMKDEKRVPQNDIPMVPNPPVMFKHPTHLVTPSEILARTASSSSQGVNLGEANIHDLAGNNDTERNEVEVKVVGETGIAQNDEFDLQRETNINVARKREKIFCSQASDLSIKMARDGRMDTYNVEGAQQANSFSVPEALERPPYSGEEEVQDLTTAKVGETANSMTGLHSANPSAKGNKRKGKTSQLAGPSSPSSSPFNSTDSSNDPGSTSSAPLTDGAMSLLRAMQERMDELMSMQKEMQKQMNVMVAVPVTKEGRRLEASLGRSMEKVVKANNDASWARLQEENVKHEKLERDRMQQLTNLITNCMNKDLPTMLERTLKKEIAAVGPSVVRSITPNFEKAISSAVSESFQKGVGDKAVNQLEKSVNLKLESTVARQIQTQFQTSGKQALQDALRSSLEASVIPAFEMSCKAMFEQVDATFQRGLNKHTAAAQQQFESTHSPLAVSLRDAINSASSLTHTLSGELADGQRKLLAIAAAGANSNAANPLVTQLSNGPLAGLHEMAEANLDPTKELSRLIAERKYEEAFTGALHRSDVALVSWLCSQVDLQGILSMTPFPLSQGVLLALLQQLACDISNEIPRKLAWMTDVAVAINPGDPMIAMHVRPIFDQVYQILGHQQSMPTTSASEASTIRILMHVINSVLMSCK